MEKKFHLQTQEEWEEEMSHKILRFVHDALYVELPFLGIALSALEPERDARLTTLATDGSRLSFSSGQLLRVFQDNPNYLNRLYLHTVLHCLFSHLWIGGGRNRYIWGIACDIAVECTIDSMEKDCTKRIIGWLRQKTYDILKEDQATVSAAQIYRFLEGMDGEELEKLHQEFFADDHVFWPKEEKQGAQAETARKNWSKIARQTQMEQKRHGKDSGEGSGISSFLTEAGKARGNYQDFLRKFAVLHEEMHCDLEDFDLNFYMYGLSVYKNMPLMEPLESREVHKIRDFVVAVDTSYSTSGELVEQFLRETFEILKQGDSFFCQNRIHVIQCDEAVRSDTVVASQDDIDALFSDFRIQGGGGTDFRPVFAYVNEMVEQGQLEHLCGMLYFTDGEGTYPEKMPDYKTAFLFLEDYREENVPAWAIRMRLE